MIKIIAGFLLLAISSAIYAAPSIDVYGRLPGVELMSLSPSGSRYAFVAVIGEKRRLMVTSEKGESLLASEIGNQKVRGLEWVGDDRILVWVSGVYSDRTVYLGTHEFWAVININIKTRKSFQIFDGTKKATSFVFGYAGSAREGEHEYGYFVGMTLIGNQFLRDQRDLYKVDLDSGETTLIAKGGGKESAFRWVVGNNGFVIAHSVYDHKAGFWRLYAGGSEERLLLERKYTPLGEIELVGRGRTTDTVWIADGSSGVSVIEEIGLADGKSETLFNDLTVSGYLNDPISGMAIGATIAEEPRAKFFDENLNARLKGARKAFPDLQMQLVSYSQNMDRIIVKTDGGDDSGTYWLVKIASGQATPIGYPYPEIRPIDVGPTQMITYKASDGMEIHAVLTLPPGRDARSLPLVVLPHGGPIGISDVVGFDWWAQAYASMGYAVLQPNYRGSGGYGKEFLSAGFGQWGRKMQTDISDGVSALAAQGLVNSKRVCIVGASYGGYAALAGVTLQHDIYRCAVSVAGVASLPSLLEGHDFEDDTTRYLRAVTGADKEGDKVLKTLSPKYLAEQASAPILLVHGRDDNVVSVIQSRMMKSALRRADKPVEFIEMLGEDHWLSREETRKAMLKASVDFVLKHNPPD
ncbi:MAG: prolyl oligopeptidase family serine peptidase [Spongiibacteraceae bacterium]